jgi:hypothetical protein
LGLHLFIIPHIQHDTVPAKRTLGVNARASKTHHRILANLSKPNSWDYILKSVEGHQVSQIKKMTFEA